MARHEHLLLFRKGVRFWNHWRNNNPDITPNLDESDLTGIELLNCNLSGVSLYGANLGGSDLKDAQLLKANLTNANLYSADLRGANLKEADLRGADLRCAKLDDCELIRANLSNVLLHRATLKKADLSYAILSHADFTNTDLTEADLSKTQSLGTDFTQAQFTGISLEDWNINELTILQDIKCRFMYLRRYNRKRLPASGEFTLGEFTKHFQKSASVVDIIFRNGINWQALLVALDRIQASQSIKISIKNINNENENMYFVGMNVPLHIDREMFERIFWNEYDSVSESVNQLNFRQMQTGQKQKETHEIDLMKVIELFCRTLGRQNMSGDTYHVGQAGAVGKDARSDGNTFYYSRQDQSLAEAAAEIQQLLEQLEQINPSATEAEKIDYVNDETTPSFKRRAASALQAGGEAAIEEFLDNPYINVGKAIVIGWLKPE
jgi:uncharacterized protein YjbI with pentapeptide repeats